MLGERINGIPITVPTVRSCWRCGNERNQVRILNGYADQPGEPRYLSICAPGYGCRHSIETCKYGPGCSFTSHTSKGL